MGDGVLGLASDEREPARKGPEEYEGPVVEGHGEVLLAAQHSEQTVSGGG